jgi:hypothetical protein
VETGKTLGVIIEHGVQERPHAVVDRRPTAADVLAGLLLVATVALHIAAMFPVYFAEQNQSLAAQTDQAAIYAVLAAAWALVLVVLLTGPARIAIAAAMAVGLSLTELGFRLSDLGEVFRYGYSQAGDGLWLMTAAWAVGGLSAVALVVAARRQSRLSRQHPEWAASISQPEHPATGDPALGSRGAWTAIVAILAVAVAGAFLPSWDRYRAVSSVTGRSVSREVGNAFTNNPWQVTLGDVLVSAALLLIPLAAIRMKNRYVGAALAVGALLVLASQLVGAVVQVDMPVSPDVIGLPASEARQLGLSLSLRLTDWYVLEAIAAFGLFAAAMVWATLRVDHENSPGTLPSTPPARSDAIPWWS